MSLCWDQYKPRHPASVQSASILSIFLYDFVSQKDTFMVHAGAAQSGGAHQMDSAHF